MLEGTFVSAIEDSTESSSEGTPKSVFQDLYKDAQEGVLLIETKGTLEVTTEIHLKMHMLVYLLVYKSAKNNVIKCELEETLYIVLKSTPKVSL